MTSKNPRRVFRAFLSRTSPKRFHIICILCTRPKPVLARPLGGEQVCVYPTQGYAVPISHLADFRPQEASVGRYAAQKSKSVDVGRKRPRTRPAGTVATTSDN